MINRLISNILLFLKEGIFFVCVVSWAFFLLVQCCQHAVQVLHRDWLYGLCLMWASCGEVGHECRCYPSEQGFGWWTLHLSEKVGYTFQMHAVHWLHPRVPTWCPSEICPTSLAEDRYLYQMGSHELSQEGWSQRKESQDETFWVIQSYEGKENKEPNNQA